jgi:hypothetical protein
MTGNDFWKLIETSINHAVLQNLGEDDYPEELVQPIEDKLAQMGIAEIEEFEEYLAKALYDIDGVIYADNAGPSGESGDGFLYCRCWVVANGKTFYEEVLNNPTRMPKTIADWCEPLLYVASNAWARKTGNNPEEWPYETKVSYETGSNSAQWDD